jgi:hypothetical protein
LAQANSPNLLSMIDRVQEGCVTFFIRSYVKYLSSDDSWFSKQHKTQTLENTI